MHHETLTLHRSPARCDRKADRAQLTRTTHAPGDRCAASRRGIATLGARPGEIPFGWDNEFGRTATSTLPAFEIATYPVTNGDWLRVRRRRRAGAALLARARRRVVSAAASSRRSRLPQSWPVYVTHTQARGIRALGGLAIADGGRVPSRGLRYAAGRRARVSVGRRRPGAALRQLRFCALRSRAGRRASRRHERLGRRRLDRQRLGVDLDAVRAAARLRADGIVPAVLGRLLRRQALRDEGRLAR